MGQDVGSPLCVHAWLFRRPTLAVLAEVDDEGDSPRAAAHMCP